MATPDAGRRRGARHLRMSRRTGRFKDNRVRALRGSRLNAGEQLLALFDAVAAGENDLKIDAQFSRSLLGDRGLLHLIIVVGVRQREQKAQLFHAGTFRSNHT
jgi:hypothetical protein